MKPGDLVRIKGMSVLGTTLTAWPECHGQIGVIIAEAKRLYIPAVKVMVLGEIAEFDLSELELTHESR